VKSPTPEDALSVARVAVGEDPAAPGRAWRVRRLDQPDRPYYLVVIGEQSAATAVAAVDAVSGETLSWATLPGQGPHLIVDAQAAVARAGLGPAASAELVWQPSVLSRSPSYPFWQVREKGHVVYVDQNGCVWSDVEPAGHGSGGFRGRS
jgi:hypothetical protein